MVNVWITSDSHLGHDNILKFVRNDGTPLRPFKTIEEHDGTLIHNWNSVVKEQDKVYHLGDVTMKDKHLKMLGACNGHKRLVRGNHDIFKTKMYMQYFEEIYGVRIFENIVFSHIPVHTESLKERWLGNAHGHLHANFVMKEIIAVDGISENMVAIKDPRYLNLCVEHTNYTPIHLDEVIKRFKDAQ